MLQNTTPDELLFSLENSEQVWEECLSIGDVYSNWSRELSELPSFEFEQRLRQMEENELSECVLRSMTFMHTVFGPELAEQLLEISKGDIVYGVMDISPEVWTAMVNGQLDIFLTSLAHSTYYAASRQVGGSPVELMNTWLDEITLDETSLAKVKRASATMSQHHLHVVH